MPRKNLQRDLVMVLAIQHSLNQHSTASSLLMVIMKMITMMIPLRRMIKQLTTWLNKDLQTRRSNTYKMPFKTRMELTHIWMIQLNIRKLERDFRTENQLSEADKERRVTKRSSRLLLMIRTKSLINWHERTRIYSRKMLVFQVKTKYLSNRFHTSKKHLQTPALLVASNNHRYRHHRKCKMLSDKKILTNSSLKFSIRSTEDSSKTIQSQESH